MATDHPVPWPAQIEGFLLSLFVNAVCPYLIFRAVIAHLGPGPTLLLAALPPVIFAIYGMVSHGRADAMSIFVLLTLVPAALVPLFGGSAQTILVRESIAGSVVGVLMLVSLMMPRPAMFYLNRSFATGNNPALVAQYNQHWAEPLFRHAMHLMTFVWGAVTVAEAVVRTVLVYYISSATFLAVSQIIQAVVFAGLMGWTLWYGRFVKRHAIAMATVAPTAASPA